MRKDGGEDNSDPLGSEHLLCQPSTPSLTSIKRNHGNYYYFQYFRGRQDYKPPPEGKKKKEIFYQDVGLLETCLESVTSAFINTAERENLKCNEKLVPIQTDNKQIHTSYKIIVVSENDLVCTF